MYYNMVNKVITHVNKELKHDYKFHELFYLLNTRRLDKKHISPSSIFHMLDYLLISHLYSSALSHLITELKQKKK